MAFSLVFVLFVAVNFQYCFVCIAFVTSFLFSLVVPKFSARCQVNLSRGGILMRMRDFVPLDFLVLSRLYSLPSVLSSPSCRRFEEEKDKRKWPSTWRLWIETLCKCFLLLREILSAFICSFTEYGILGALARLFSRSAFHLRSPYATIQI